MRPRRCVFLMAASLVASLTAGPPGALERITEDGLRANLSFLASDALEGRGTPSPGQAVAAEFIASRFRLAHLEPAADGGYCQLAEFGQWTPAAGGEVTLSLHGRPLTVPAQHFAFSSAAPVNLNHVPLLRTKPEAGADVAGKAVVVEAPLHREQRLQLLAAKPALLITVFKTGHKDEEGTHITGMDAEQPVVPRMSLWGDEGLKLLKDLTPDSTLTVHVAAPALTRIHACNVAGVLRGSDRELRQEYVLLTAHYDHLPMAASGADRIFNGANDDGSGTVSVIEIAQALAAMPVKPRRSIVFIAFSGEELGLLGSRYYAKHPLFPLARTVAQINLEQLGRTNAADGFAAGAMTFTGFGFTDLPRLFETAATGIRVYATKDSNDYFARSDNQALADAGIPSTTVAVAYTYPDYHAVSDEWQKIEFANMAKVDQAIAAGVIALADRAAPPHWNDDARTEPYRQAYGRLHPTEAVR